MPLDIISSGEALPKITIDRHEYVGIEGGQRYAVRISNPGPVTTVIKLWINNIPQKKVITKLRDLFDFHPEQWRLPPRTFALHPPEGHYFVYDGPYISVMAEVYDLDGHLHKRHELRLRRPEVLERLQTYMCT
jgi:hypothetical protein